MRTLSSLWKKNTHTALGDGIGHVGISLANGGLSTFKLPFGGNCRLEIWEWV